MSLGDPCRVGTGQEVDEVVIVDPARRIEAEIGRFDDRAPGREQLGVQPVAPHGFLVARFPHAEPVAPVGLVAPVPLAPHHRHPQSGAVRRCHGGGD